MGLFDLPLGGRSTLQPSPADCADPIGWGVLEAPSASRAVGDPPVHPLDTLGHEALDAQPQRVSDVLDFVVFGYDDRILPLVFQLEPQREDLGVGLR